MDEIKKGGSLRHVSPEKKSKAVPDSRGELMGQIRLGVALKKVDSDPGQDGPVVQQSAPGIAGMLQRALQERGMVMGMRAVRMRIVVKKMMSGMTRVMRKNLVIIH